MDLAPLFWACSAGLVATVTPYGFAMLPADISCSVATEDGWQSGARRLRPGWVPLGSRPQTGSATRCFGVVPSELE